jgi:ribonuclease I
MSNDTSEPAFPVQASEYGGHGTCFGMSLRDYFAAKAMQGFNANPRYDGYTHDVVAEIAYVQADAMLAARVKP